MAAPLKRVSRQAARSVQKTSPSSTSRLSLRPSFCISSARCYSHTSRRPAAQQDLAEDDFDSYLEALDENLPNEQELSSTAHSELEQHRELREMVRLAAWQMPLLSKLAQPFEAPDRTKLPLRWRYTTYLGEPHPASRKVVVEFDISHLEQGKVLGERESLKLKKLAGARYNPEKNKIRMSCEAFESQAQNKRYLADTVDKLIAEAKDLSSDSFEDVPLDTRHHKAKKVFKFPEEWKMTEERRAKLEQNRTQALLAEGKKVEEDRIVSGAAAIEHDRKIRLSRVEEPVMAQARQPLAQGKMGKREMGQRSR